jgi:NADPH-dependent curcumin reductase CurA
MSQAKNLRVVLASRPVGEPGDDNFKLEESALPKPAVGQVLLRTLFLSLDPYMRGRMSDAKSYAEPVQIGDVMVGGTVCEVLESEDAALKKGDTVVAYTGWQSHAVVSARTVRKIDQAADLKGLPLSTALGVLGMPGMTAYTGLLNIGQPKAGETIVVAAASGAVGAVVGQIAKIKGCRVVGIAGGKRKCDYVTGELGFDLCVDHKDAGFAAKLKQACPNGIDVYFENVGGPVFDAVLPLLNDFARIPVCGLINHYNDSATTHAGASGPDRVPLLMRAILTKRLTFRGFIVSDFGAQTKQFESDMSTWVTSGQVKYLEDVVDGLDKAPRAFQGLLRGENFGKLVVKV